eukprot:TRINITY_DN58728_c0_g1_i1.p1 TRINITY_DN58728_c0_g1~~TRINITY_DN58728_c0_g1_i1.p1  ORF type:complete len:241 (-),score=31.69 TRINITY_DN58728_c0_g1_i1:240-962(-)
MSLCPYRRWRPGAAQSSAPVAIHELNGDVVDVEKAGSLFDVRERIAHARHLDERRVAFVHEDRRLKAEELQLPIGSFTGSLVVCVLEKPEEPLRPLQSPPKRRCDCCYELGMSGICCPCIFCVTLARPLDGMKKCVDPERTMRTSVLPSILCCLLIPCGLSIALFLTQSVSKVVALAIIFGVAASICICWPMFAAFNAEELQGDYDEGTGLEGCYLHTFAMLCCTLIFCGGSVGIVYALS